MIPEIATECRGDRISVEPLMLDIIRGRLNSGEIFVLATTLQKLPTFNIIWSYYTRGYEILILDNDEKLTELRKRLKLPSQSKPAGGPRYAR